MRRITKAALSGFAGCALILGVSQAANGDSANMTYLLEGQCIPHADKVCEGGDFQSVSGPFDGATGTLRVMQAPDDAATGFKLTVEQINVEDFKWAADREFGAHLHTGPCVNGDYSGPFSGGLAGPHYNHETATTGNSTPAVNTHTEVWFNLVPNDHGDATDDAKVNFVPIDSTLGLGEMSIVIHALPTNTEFGIPTAGQKAGYAGDRWACFKLVTPDWAP